MRSLKENQKMIEKDGLTGSWAHNPRFNRGLSAHKPISLSAHKPISLFCVLCLVSLVFLIGLSGDAASRMKVYPQDTEAAFEYDDNVTRERLREDYQYGIVWRLYTGFGVRDFIPVKGLNTDAWYTLGMRDVNTTNDEDYNSHSANLSSEARLKTGTSISLKEAFKIWNSQSDLFNFYDNSVEIEVDQPFGEKTKAHLSYKNEQKRFQNDAPEVQARNFLYHQVGMDVSHRLSNALGVQVGYMHQSSMYNRSPIDFRGGRQIVLPGVQRDRQNIITLAFWAFLFNDTTTLTLQNQFVKSISNSLAFNFDGNRTQIILVSKPFQKLSVDFTYRIVAYDLGAYQTPDKGYELSEIRTEDQSGITIGMTYDISDQMSLQLGYGHIENSVFFTREFYKKNTFSTGLRVKF
jgi:hypothetical protein